MQFTVSEHFLKQISQNMTDPLTQQHNQNQLFLETHIQACALHHLLLLSLHYCSGTSITGDMTSKPTFYSHTNLL
jgi:hypothetical protein